MKTLSAIIALAILLPVFPATVSAHFTEPVPEGWNEWAGRQYSMRGSHCCLFSHAYLYPDEYTYNPNGSVTVVLQGQIVVLPADRFVNIQPDDPNPTGNAVVWYDSIDPSASQIYCFTPPGALG